MALGCLLAWTALRRNDGSGLGVAYACAVGHPRRLDRVLTVLSCAVGRPIRVQSLNSFKGFRGFRRFRGLRAGKRQAWTPIRSLRSHCCGLGVPVGMDRAEKKRWIWPWGSLCLRGWASQTLGQSFNGFKLRGWASHTLWQSFNGFKGLRAGKRQAWTPIRSLRSHCCGFGVPVGMDRAEKKRWIWPWGSLCLRGWAAQTLGQSFNGCKLRGWASHTLWQSLNSFKGRFKGF